MFSFLTPFAKVHVIVSLLGIVSGLVVLYGMMNSRRYNGMTIVFLLTTIYTNVSSFGFPFIVLMPSHIIAGLSLVILALTVYARYAKHMSGRWRATYVITAVAALYFNVFVLIVQMFRRIPALIELAPTQSEPPFAVVQLVVLGLFVWLGIRAVKRFHPSSQAATPASAVPAHH